MVAAGGNRLLAELYEHLSATITRTIAGGAGLEEDHRVHALHRDLLEAIRSHDPDRAEAISGELVDEGRRLHADEAAR